MNNRYNRYQTKRPYNKGESFNRKNRLISVLVVLAITLLFIINHLHYENKSLHSEIDMLNNEISEMDSEMTNLKKEIDSLKPKPIQIIEKEKPKFTFTKSKKDTTKTPVKPIVVPVVTTPVDTNSH